MIALLVNLLVLVLVLGLFSFLIARAPVISAEYKTIAQYVLLVVAVLLIIGMLTGTVPRFPVVRWS